MAEDPIQHAVQERRRVYDALRTHLGTSMPPERLMASIDVLARIAEWPIEDSSDLGEGWERARAEAIREAIATASAYLRLLYLDSGEATHHREAS